MANKKQQRRLAMFERQSNALDRFLYGDDRSLILCPLCLRAWEERYLAEPGMIQIEHAPPRQYPPGVERCLTCGECNGEAGRTFENRTADLNERRDEAVAAATAVATYSTAGLLIPPRRPPIFLSEGAALKLATVGSDERKLELKSAYLVAFAALGYTYILSSGLACLREMLDDKVDLGDQPVCAVLQGLEPDRIMVMTAPIECLIVPHPTRHTSGDSSGHVVFLPLPTSPPDFYDRIRTFGTLLTRHRWRSPADYALPRTRRMPMEWDKADHRPRVPMGTWELECTCAPGSHDAIELRLAEPKDEWVRFN